MPIKGFESEAELAPVLSAHLSSAREISDPARLFGRDKHLREIRRSFMSPGKQVFIFGERGVGKTSLAQSAATANTYEGASHIYLACGSDSTFHSVIDTISSSLLSNMPALRDSLKELTLSLQAFGFGLGLSGSFEAGDDKTQSQLQDALEVFNHFDERLNGQVVVVIDEIDRIRDDLSLTLLSEFIKNIPGRTNNFKFIYCGIGESVEKIIGSHLSSGRSIEPISLDRMHHDSLWAIVKSVTEPLNIFIDEQILTRISIVSDGFPYFVHLIAEKILWAMHDDQNAVSTCSRAHYKQGVDHALANAETSLVAQYNQATKKSRNTAQYEQALWALADRVETRRQVSAVYEDSYLRIVRKHFSEENHMGQGDFNQRLLAMRGDRHGSILNGYGAGWFGFTENVMRGYIRLLAESHDIELLPEPGV